MNLTSHSYRFQAFLDVDIRIPEAQLTAAVENAGARINGLLAALKAAILVENLVESAKVRMIGHQKLDQFTMTMCPSSLPWACTWSATWGS